MDERAITSTIDREAASRTFVFVDLEGVASRLVSRAIIRSDLVLIPMQASAVDAAQAARAVGLVREEEETVRRVIPYRVLFTRTSAAIATRAEKGIAAEMERAGIATLTNHLNERAAYKAVFEHKRSLSGLDPTLVNGVPAAVKNAEAVAAEVTDLLRTIMRGQAA